MDVANADRWHAWLLLQLGDRPLAGQVYEQLARRDPEDIEAAWHSVARPFEERDYETALAMLQGVERRRLTMRDGRVRQIVPAQLVWRRCAALRHLGRFDEALADCERAAKDFSWVAGEASLTIARIQLALGQHREALARTTALTRDPETTQAHFWFIHALALEANGRAEEGGAACASALRANPSFTPAWNALQGKTATVEERLEDEQRWHDAAYALDFARCWHNYTELGLNQRADACAAVADRIVPGRVGALRVAHLAETSLEQALAEGERQLAKHPHADIHAAMGWALNHARRFQAARDVLEKGASLDPTNSWLGQELLRACEGLGDSACVQAWEPRVYGRQELAFRSAERLRRQVLVGLGGLFVVGVLLLVGVRMRRRGARRQQADAATRTPVDQPRVA